jgi:hypothetical protein
MSPLIDFVMAGIGQYGDALGLTESRDLANFLRVLNTVLESPKTQSNADARP